MATDDEGARDPRGGPPPADDPSPRLDLTPLPRRGSAPVTPPTGVPGRSFQIPSIPNLPRPKTPPPVAERPEAVPLETQESVSGDLTVPTDAPFKEPSVPWAAASIVVQQAGGKARNRAPGVRPRSGSSPPPEPSHAAVVQPVAGGISDWTAPEMAVVDEPTERAAPPAVAPPPPVLPPPAVLPPPPVLDVPPRPPAVVPPQPSSAARPARPAARRRDRDATELVSSYPEITEAVALPGRARPLVIGAIALGVVGIGVAIGMAIGGGGGGRRGGPARAAAPATAVDAAPRPRATAVVAVDAALPPAPEDDAAPMAAAPPDAGVAATADLPGTPAPGECQVHLATTPPDATYAIGRLRGKTPATVAVPCARASVVLSHPRYRTETRALAPREGTTVEVAVRLVRPTFAVKIVSRPKGATVTVQGHAVGTTPVTAKVPGFEAITVKLAKPGYAPATTKVTAKKDGGSVSVTLHRGR